MFYKSSCARLCPLDGNGRVCFAYYKSFLSINTTAKICHVAQMCTKA